MCADCYCASLRTRILRYHDGTTPSVDHITSDAGLGLVGNKRHTPFSDVLLLLRCNFVVMKVLAMPWLFNSICRKGTELLSTWNRVILEQMMADYQVSEVTALKRRKGSLPSLAEFLSSEQRLHRNWFSTRSIALTNKPTSNTFSNSQSPSIIFTKASNVETRG
jgi:hypothetical protein